MIQRRQFFTACALATPAAWAQTGARRAPRLSWLGYTDQRAGADQLARLRLGLAEYGWLERSSIELVELWADDSRERLDQMAVALARERPDLVVAQGPAVLALARARATMPVVFTFSGDPVEAGLAESLGRPGRNFTGITQMSVELVGKRLQMLREAAPTINRVGAIANTAHAGERQEREATRVAARALGLEFEYIPLAGSADAQPALDAALRLRCDGLMVFPDAGMMRHSARIAEFSVRHRMPAISGLPEFATGGNLLAYGPDRFAMFHRLAHFADRILRGAAPSDLPIEQPTRLALTVNRRTAQALGLTLPAALLLRADEVIG